MPHMPARTPVLFLALPLLFACGEKKGEVDRRAGVLSESPNADGLIEQKIDLNADGQADVTNYFRERDDAPRLLVLKENNSSFSRKMIRHSREGRLIVLNKRESLSRRAICRSQTK